MRFLRQQAFTQGPKEQSIYAFYYYLTTVAMELSTESTKSQLRGLTLGANLIEIGALLERVRALPLAEFDRELGYACTWAGGLSSANANKNAIAGYISLAKALCIFALVLFIFLVRYRDQAGTFKLFYVLRRDSGVYILSLAVISSGNFKLGWFSIPDEILGGLNYAVIPVLANRLLLNIWRTEDPEVRKSVSSILFDPPRPGEDSEDEDEEFGDSPIEMVRYEGLGRRRAPAAREESEGTPQGGTGVTQAAENGEGV
ncbi:hypothetical protein DFP72DRAFT_851971 [Ephemerocybe angulata]|uniref:Uncharacterized protein n=1 Tax=Ephemerocybe angulata TaxID=980116 RepID=A0A8H6HNY2_9AGAR|nr:hypothetical protein DFP72DRAFT_851971 [Tulosesus angulatus]